MKNCYKCKGPNNTSQSYCKECRKVIDFEYNQRRDKQKKYLRQRERENKNKEWVYSYLQNNPCKCGESRPECLDFHHLKDKQYSVSNMYSLSISKIQLEIAKCKVLCANCHRVITAKENNWYKFKT